MYSSSKRLSTVILKITEPLPIQLKIFDTPKLNKPYVDFDFLSDYLKTVGNAKN